ncbi:MAG: alpha-L-fucosidase [Puniceicoccales bacterium]|nr:alpha-L-fucosidase [Puniceicoccales bacterium]
MNILLKKFFSTCAGAAALASAFVATGVPVSADGPYAAKWASLDKRPAPEWFLDAKFGIFIHWGLYSVPAFANRGQYAEWYWSRLGKTRHGGQSYTSKFQEEKYGKGFKYEDFAPLFTAEKFDARKWAELFAKSGARYIVPTSKHHEGFALWPSAEASKSWGRPWNAAEIGPKRDLLGELGEAVRDKGLKYGFYFSLYEWHNPLWIKDRKRFIREVYHPQFKDLVNRYKPSLLFGDGEWDISSKDWGSEELIAWLYNESPSKDDVIINDRWGKDTRLHHGGYYTTEYGAGLKDASHPWEENRGIGFSFGYNHVEIEADYKTSRELILVLSDLVSRGGNLLLNIGPKADGTIPEIMEKRLLDIGAWLAVNGEAIYGTRVAGRPCQWTAGKRPKQSYKNYKAKYNLMEHVGQATVNGNAVKQVFYTQKKDALYAISVGWPEGATLTLQGVSAPQGAIVTVLGLPNELKYEITKSGITIALDGIPSNKLSGAPAYTFKITNAVVSQEDGTEAKTGAGKKAEKAGYTGEKD